MCLSTMTIKKYKRKRNWVKGYKVLRWSATKVACWRSQYARQKWEFAELVEAVNPTRIKFRGKTAHAYANGIHAWKTFNEAAHACFLRPSEKIVKVLLFGVTHHDRECYRADAAIIIEALDGQGHREKWNVKGSHKIEK